MFKNRFGLLVRRLSCSLIEMHRVTKYCVCQSDRLRGTHVCNLKYGGGTGSDRSCEK
jgi:hypothetical protein